MEKVAAYVQRALMDHSEGRPHFTFILSPLFNQLSRRHEFEADAYARETTGDPASLASALKKLSVESMSNLNPHPWKVILDYSHPPVTQRLRALQ